MIFSLTPTTSPRTIAFFVVIVIVATVDHYSLLKVNGLASSNYPSSSSSSSSSSSPSSSKSRRHVIGSLLGGISTATAVTSLVLPGDGRDIIGIGIGISKVANAAEMDVDSFLQSGGVAMPMGVSGQAGKSKPITNIVFREQEQEQEQGQDNISRDTKTGNVIAEILVQKSGSSKNNNNDDNLMAVVTSFSAPWPLATGMVYDVECRDSKTGDAAFLAVSPPIIDSSGVSSISDIKDKDIIKSLFGLRGRFSFYGVPTDVKIKKSTIIDNNDDGSSNNYKILDVNFSTLSQATQTEVPRKSRIVATLPKGSNQIVMLVGSSSATRWTNNGSEKAISSTVQSFRAIPAPKSNLKIRRARTKDEELFD